VKKIFGILLALALALGVSLVTATPVAANTVGSSTIVFESQTGYTLTDNGDGTYSGVIPCKVDGGFDIYAKEDATAYMDDTPVVISDDHDAWSTWTPDTPDWYQYSLHFYEESGVHKWALRNHAGATAETPWYDGGDIARGVPMSGIMDWDTMYAWETDVGAYLPGTGTAKYPGKAESHGGGAGYWDMDWSWGSEAVPLQFAGFAVEVTPSGSYIVTLTPADPPNTVPSSTMVFDGELTDAGGGVYTGTIPMVNEETESLGDGIAGFDVYAKEGGCAYVEGHYGTGGWNCDGTDTALIDSTHDAYSSGGPWGTWYDPDCADWDQYSLELTADHWYLRYTATGESPMSGVMYWYGDGTGYAAETDLGTVRNDDGSNPTDPLNRDATRYASGSAQEWGWHCGWGEERIPLELAGFAVEVTPGGSYVVTLTPADGPVKNLNTDVTYGNIQSAVDDASPGDTIQVSAGMYAEQVVINKDLTLQGIGDPVIKVPASPAAFTFPESSKSWEPVVFAFGGTEVGGSISGSDTITVDISGFTIDGNDRVPTQRSAGILLRNAGGTISDNTAQNMSINGKETFGIMVYGDSDVVIMGNDVSGYARGGIGANGDSVTSSPSYPTPHAVIQGNTVTGPGMDKIVTWAPNGIQIGWKATGKIVGNNVSGNGWPGTEWSGSGIIVAGADDVEVDSNTLKDNETGISVCGYMWDPAGLTAEGTWIHHNTVDGNTYGISIQDKSLDTTIEYNTVKNSSYDGIDICNFYGYAPTGTVIRSNTITGNNAEDDANSGGIWIDDGVDGNEVTANFNNIADNYQFGIINTSTTNNVDATYNWWGAASGPYHPMENPGGTGNAVSDYVDFDPWAQAEFPTVTTQAATAVDTDSATLHMTYTMGSYDSVDVRFAYKKSVHSAWSYTTWVPKSAAGTHTEMLIGLDSGTQYDFKAQLRYDEIVYGEKTIGGATLKFTTVAVPTVATQAATEIGYLLTTFNMDYTVGGLSPVQVRFAYKKSTDTEWHYTTWVSKAADGSYAHRVAGLRAGTTYNFKAQLKYDDAPLIEGSTRGFGTHTIAVGCFIATAAYGTPSAEQIDVLRDFRDTVLLESTVGSQFVALYYQLSPPVAEFIAGNELLRTMVREFLVDPIVWVVEATEDIWQN